jgi:hypothetical protein
MSQAQKTLKLEGYKPTARPEENGEVKWWRQWLVEIIYALYFRKKQLLVEMGFPARPVHQNEIYREKCSRVLMLKAEGIWGRTQRFPHSQDHDHNWIERRVNECATEEFGPHNGNGILKVVNTSAGLYEPNPKLFEGKK